MLSRWPQWLQLATDGQAWLRHVGFIASAHQCVELQVLLLWRCGVRSKTEMLAKSNKFECETCGSHQEAQRRIKIRAAPSCLILHLKRFKFIEHLRR